MATTIRHLGEGEPTPFLLKEFANLKLDGQWAYLAENEQGKVVGALLTANVHGLLAILRLITDEEAPPTTALRLLRAAFRESRERGLLGAVTLLEPRRPVERKLGKLLERKGTDFLPLPQALLVMTSLNER